MSLFSTIILVEADYLNTYYKEKHMKTYNFTLHHLDGEQKLDGITELPGWIRNTLHNILTFRTIPTRAQMEDRARAVVSLALMAGADVIMIAPAPFFASTLEEKLEEHGIMSVYPYSSHVSANTTNSEGYIQRSGTFEYVGLVEGNFEGPHELWDHNPVRDNIINLTRLNAFPEQTEAGVIEPDDKKDIIDAITFMKMPTKEAIRNTAELLSDVALRSGCSKALINGTPYLMRSLENSLIARNITPVYSFTDRKLGEYKDDNGLIKKMYSVKHLGFIEMDKERKRKAWTGVKDELIKKDDIKVNVGEIDTSLIEDDLEKILGDLEKEI